MPGNRPVDQVHTAADYARALGVSRVAVHKRLRACDAVEVRTPSGQMGKAWAITFLPEDYRQRLQERAMQTGCGSIERLMQVGPEPWQPAFGSAPVKLSDLADHCIQTAQDIRRAIREPLRSYRDGKLARADFEAVGRRDYQAVTGKSISAPAFRRIVDRIAARIRLPEDIDRLEVYLPAKLARKQASKPATVEPFVANDFPEVRERLDRIADPLNPSKEELVDLWDAVCTTAIAATRQDATRAALLDLLWNSPVELSSSRHGLRQQLSRKWQAWLDGEGKSSVLKDRRGRERWEMPEEDYKLILARVVEHNGKVQTGIKAAILRKELSPETMARMPRHDVEQVHLPKRILRALKREADNLLPYHRGPREHIRQGAYIKRDWSKTYSGDHFEADDVTLNHYYYERTPEGLKVMRGQCLLFCDRLTGLILGFVLHSEQQYNARIIREGILHVSEQWGLPREAFFFEQGIWQARMIAGSSKTEVGFEQTERGLGEIGIKVQCARAANARSKVVENIIGLVQTRMQHLPGYAGRNEMVEKFERVQRNIRNVRNGKTPPERCFMEKRAYADALVEVIKEYNQVRQYGRLQGFSPEEAWQQRFNTDQPLLKLTPETRFLLANHRKPVRVTRNGVRLTLRGQSIYYRARDLGRLIGQEVIAWYRTDEDFPASITITDTDYCNPMQLEREVEVDATHASPEDLRSAYAQVSEMNRYARDLYRTIKPRFRADQYLRGPDSVDIETEELGRAIDEGQQAAKDEQRRDTTSRAKVRRHARESGFALPANHRNPQEQAASARELDELMASWTQEEDDQ